MYVLIASIIIMQVIVVRQDQIAATAAKVCKSHLKAMAIYRHQDHLKRTCPQVAIILACFLKQS